MSAKKAIDWAEVQGRLRASQEGLEKALQADPARIAAIFRERAEELARRGSREKAPAATVRTLVFGLGQERYALAADDLVEMLPYTSCTPVAGAPAELLGVANVRGEIRSVVDLGSLLGLPGGGGPGFVLLVRREGRVVGLRVDRLEKIELVSLAALAVPDAGDSERPLRFLRGLAPGGLKLLSTEALLAHPLFAEAPR